MHPSGTGGPFRLLGDLRGIKTIAVGRRIRELARLPVDVAQRYGDQPADS